MTTTQQPQTAMAIIDYRQAPVALAHFGADRVQQVCEQIGRGWKQPMSLAELDHIGLICERTRLDPLVKPALIYFIQRFDKQADKYVMTPQVSIDGLRLIASRSRDYVTQVGPEWCGPDGRWRDIWTGPGNPTAARVGVVRRGAREPLWSVALWSECVQDTPFWKQRPAHMLAKTAEGNAIKRAVPAETNELELAHLEEMERLEVPARAAEYVRIHGSDQDSTALYDLPAPRAVTIERDVEVAAPVEQSPRRATLIDTYANLVKQAIELHVIVGSEMDWIAAAGGTDDQIIEKGRALRARVNQTTIDRGKQPTQPTSTEEQLDAPPQEPPTEAEKATPRNEETGEILDGSAPAEKPRIAGWARHRQLVAEAHKRNLTVLTLNARTTLDLVDEANVQLEQRIRDYDYDQQLAAEQDRLLA
jgi:hypothetical protein